MNPAIDVSTHQLAQLTEKAMGGKVGLDEILAVWHEIGNVIKDQLVQRKAVRLSSFGTFGFSVKGEPIFILATEFATQFKVKQRGQPPVDSVPTASLNFAQIQNTTGTPRDVIEKIYTKFMTTLGRCLFEGRSILLTIHRVAEIEMIQGELFADFIPAFRSLFAPVQGSSMERMKKAAQKTSTLVKASKMFEDGVRRDRTMGSTDRPSSVGRQRPTAATERARPSSAGRNMYAAPGPGDFARPGSASTRSSASAMASPRLNYTDGNRRPAAHQPLTKQALDRQAATQRPQRPTSAGEMANRAAYARQEMPDARRIAAQALDIGDVINKVRARIVERGGSNGIRSISRLLAIMDDNGDKRLSKDELRYGLRDYGIDLTPTELEQVFLYFDRDRNGFIDCTEFLIGIRGELTERRKQLVRMAFNVLDKDGSGEISVDEVLQAYDLTWHPEVRAGKMTVKEAAKDFMKQWDKQQEDGMITVSEFEDYYKELSASIDDDDYFELMIRNAWRIAGGTGAAANTANRRVLVTNKDGSQSIQTIEQELGMRGRGEALKEDIRTRLGRQGVQADSLDLFGGYDDVAPPAARRGRGPPAPPARLADPRAARGDQRARPKEAWMEGPRGGDQGMAPPSPRASPRPSSGRSSGVFDPVEVLHRLLYSPPTNIEALCAKLQVSSVNASPRVAQGAFLKRLNTLDPSLERGHLAAIWKVVDPKNLGSVEVSSVLSLLADRYGKDKGSQKNASVIDRVVAKILERCGENAGIKGLSRTLAIMDNSGDKKLSKEELKFGLREFGIDLNLRELDDLFTFFDRDRSGLIDIDELLIGIRGDLNERRAKLVQMAFNLLDTDRSGYVSVDEMMEAYDFKAHPEVVSGKKSVKEAAKEFMKQWDRSDSDGMVTYEEFEDYYKGISASIDGDDYFELMIRNAWRIAGGTGAAANTANRRVLVTNKDGSQSIQTIEQELGMRGRGEGLKEDIRARLGRQGVQAEGIEMYGGYEDMSKARTSRGPPQRPGAPSGRSRPGAATMPAPKQQQQQGASQFQRNVAAMKLAAAYRGRLGRKKAEGEKRKAFAEQREYAAEQEELNRPKPRDITRPKGKSYIGF